MHSVKDLFSRLSCRTSEIVKDYNEFKDWLKVGDGVSEAEQLKWIFESTKISDKAKRLLAKSIADESSVVEDEKDTLLKVGDSSRRHMELIEITKKDVNEGYYKERKWMLTLAIMFFVAYFFVCVYCNANASGAGKTVALLFFACGVMCLTKFWDASISAKNYEKEAFKFENERVGRKTQERIAELEKEEERLYELNKIIVRCSTNENSTESN